MNEPSNLQNVPEEQRSWGGQNPMHDLAQEQVARELVDRARALGQSWGSRLRADKSQPSDRLWPGRLQDARVLVEQHIGTTMREDVRESLALIVERGARSAWLGDSGSE